jgi:hypothetical protein
MGPAGTGHPKANTMTADPVENPQQNDVFRSAPMIRFPLGSDRELVYFPLQKTAQVLDAEQLRLLGSCRQFADLSAHAGRLSAGTPMAPGEVLQRLGTLANSGAMLSGEALIERASSFADPGNPAKISWLAIPTKNRPAQLMRALDSYTANFSRYGRRMKLLVADDSRSVKQSRALKALLKARYARSGHELHYFGIEEKRQYVDLLTRDGEIPREVVEFALFGPDGHAPTMGANRNAILLLTAGEMLLSVDDDTVCQPRAPLGSDVAGPLRLGSEGDPSGFWSFPDHESALAFTAPMNLDVASAHEQLLGQPLWSLFREAAAKGALDLSTACDHIMESIWTGRGQVYVTVNGSVGDSGLYSQRSLMTHPDPETRARLIGSEEAYRVTLRSREVMRHTPRATVCHGGPFISMFVGVDNRGLLPPFFPAFRSEDRVFGSTLAACVNPCYFGHLPWTMVHAPSRRRRCDPEAAYAVRVSDLLCACYSTWAMSKSGLTVSDRLQSLGRHLLRIGVMEDADLREFLHVQVLRQAAGLSSRENGLLQLQNWKPEYWAAGLQAGADARLASALRTDYAMPVELQSDSRLDDPLAQVRRFIRWYGELLRWWPAIVDRARDMQMPLG